ncbi:hypothetical protein PACTADRAFT_46047 [Pachysolen tannophilus NRRL Y-2460]|uniref:dolichol kinase n=1 Tax=Pachysolen tannophilus NRRL Y-2460 TaxID=669874 RepID=A0A1E4TQH1_PACTA|nr:hypothetical protein PACTADRAFT_46047 [Pachysolen tannophilus NRRL Y-2460]
MKRSLGPINNQQLEFFNGVGNYLKENTTSENFIQTLLVLFIVNLFYSTFHQTAGIDISTIGFCWLGAISSYVVNHITQHRKIKVAIEKGEIQEDSIEAKVTVPPFENLYVSTLPILICYLLRKDLLVINLGMVFALMDSPDIINIFTSTAVMYNFQEKEDGLSCVTVPVLHYVIRTIIDYYVENSLNKPEKCLFATLFVNLVFAVNDETSDVVLVIFKYLIYWFAGLTITVTPLYWIYSDNSKNFWLRNLILICIYAIFIVGFYNGVVNSLTPILKNHPLSWLKIFITQSKTRFKIMEIWIGLFFTITPIFLKFSSSWQIDLKRKIWHFILFFTTLHPLIIDPELVKLAFVGLIGVFMIIETLRCTRLPPFGPQLANLLKPYQDHRDNQGPIVISYLFLLFGVALPIFWKNSVAGLICLGLGDSAASIIGRRIGSLPWFETKKTMEGTLAFLTFSIIGLYFYKYMGGDDYSFNSILMSSVFTAMLEAVSHANDNLLAPAYMFAMLEVTKNS